MPSSEQFFQTEWQDFFREAIEDDQAKSMLLDLIAQRERLIARVAILARAKGRELNVTSGASTDFALLVVQKAQQEGRTITENDVQSWLESNGISWSSLTTA